MTKKINPRVDIAFKKIFGVEENKDLLIMLINSIVSEADQIKDVTFLNPYNAQNFQHDKLSILDIKAEGHNKKRYHIEIQLSDEGNYDKRALHNWAKVYTEQLQSGDNYKKLNKTIGIHILNFLSIPNSAKYHNVFQLRERDTGLHYFSDTELHTIELKKFEDQKGQPHVEGSSLTLTEELQNLLSKIKNALDIWIAFLTRNDLLNKDALPKEIDSPGLRKALQVIEIMNLSNEERDAYEVHLNWLRMEVSAVNKAQEGAEAEGFLKGKAEGKAEGEAKARLEMVMEMLDEGIEIDLISKLSKIPEAEIRELQKTHDARVYLRSTRSDKAGMKSSI